MRWPWLPPSGGDLVAIILGAVLLAAVFLVLFRAPNMARSTNAGFGPDWDCTAVPKGEPICIKRPPTSSAVKAVPAN
jgi:hypothetical protein